MPSDFWEEFGRAVASFGHLELMLKKTIVSLPLKNLSEKEISEKLNRIEQMATSSLKLLIDELENLASNLDTVPCHLIEQLRFLQNERNTFVHASWQSGSLPSTGYPFYMKRGTPIY